LSRGANGGVFALFVEAWLASSYIISKDPILLKSKSHNSVPHRGGGKTPRQKLKTEDGWKAYILAAIPLDRAAVVRSVAVSEIQWATACSSRYTAGTALLLCS
jgi:hypothetical protein